jgi:4-amino-4-deoxy-L-arabinose transferase-like glycosyltransferase
LSAASPGAATREPGFALFLVLVLGLTALRLVGQHFSVVDLDVDEAQYWDWSRELAFGYFSKPPLIAWVNAASGLVCGESIPCIRAPSPIFYLGTSLLIYATADLLYGRTAAFWAGVSAAIAIGVSFSSRIMTTDVLLLFFWALALHAFVRLLRGGGLGWALLLGAALGLGMLAKYAMAYFGVGMVLAALVSREARALWRDPRLWLALVVALLVFAPNVVWNMQQGFPTAKATAAYTQGGHSRLHLGDALGFFVSQFAVAGPVAFFVLLALIFRFGGRDVSRDDRLMLLFAIPPLLIVLVNAAASGHSNANWAATGFISAFIVTAAYMVRGGWHRLLWAGAIVGVVAQAALLIVDPLADRITLPGFGGDIFARVLGWRALGEKVGALADETKASSVAVDGRGDAATLIYYRRGDQRPIYVWASRERAANHFEMTRPLAATAPEPVLLISTCDAGERLRQFYGSVSDLGPFAVATGPTTSRKYSAYLVSGAIKAPGGVGLCG